MEKYNKILKELKNILDGKFENDRQYPPFEQSMKNVAKASSAILHKEITAKDITIIMVLLKLDRESKKSKLDNIKDAAAYLLINLKLENYGN